MMAHRLLRFLENFEALVTALANAVPADQRSEAQQQLLSVTQRQVEMLHQAACVLTAEPIAARQHRVARNQREFAGLTDRLESLALTIRCVTTRADLVPKVERLA